MNQPSVLATFKSRKRKSDEMRQAMHYPAFHPYPVVYQQDQNYSSFHPDYFQEETSCYYQPRTYLPYSEPVASMQSTTTPRWQPYSHRMHAVPSHASNRHSIMIPTPSQPASIPIPTTHAHHPVAFTHHGYHIGHQTFIVNQQGLSAHPSIADNFQDNPYP